MEYSIRECKSYSFGNKQHCKEIFTMVFKNVDKTFNKFEWIPEYDQVIEWMVDTKGKGLALFGSIGRGKTVINSFMMPIFFKSKYNKILTPKIATELKQEYWTGRWSYLIDDIGTENIINDFGNKVDMVAHIINQAEHCIGLLFLTGNLTEKELIARYGLRTFDRIKRLCKIVIFTGKSLRV